MDLGRLVCATPNGHLFRLAFGRLLYSRNPQIYMALTLTDLLHTKQVMYMAYLPRRLTYVMTIMVSVSLLHRIWGYMLVC